MKHKKRRYKHQDGTLSFSVYIYIYIYIYIYTLKQEYKGVQKLYEFISINLAKKKTAYIGNFFSFSNWLSLKRDSERLQMLEKRILRNQKLSLIVVYQAM